MKPKLLTTLQTYTPQLFAADAVAGVTVAMVALPLSIAIAVASGAAPDAGIITAVVGGLLISLLGGSRVQIGGPTGAFIVVAAGIIAHYGYDGIVLATLMAGGILLVAAMLRMGSLIRFIPEGVVNGFTIGIAILIAASQLTDLFGLTLEGAPASFLQKMPALWAARGTINPEAFAIGLASIVMIVAFRRFAPKAPGLIVAVALTSAACAALNIPVETIASRFGPLAAGLPAPALPAFTLARLLELLPSALTIAFLAGVESLLSAIVGDRMMGGSHRPNAEILAQGAANIGSALFGGLPATGAIARTATNVRAGARTPVAGIVHALAILAAVMLAAPLAGYLAMPALSGVLIVTAWTMSEPHRWRLYMGAPMPDRCLLLLTLTLTVLADLTVAIGAGVAVGLGMKWFGRAAPPADLQGTDG